MSGVVGQSQLSFIVVLAVAMLTQGLDIKTQQKHHVNEGPPFLARCPSGRITTIVQDQAEYDAWADNENLNKTCRECYTKIEGSDKDAWPKYLTLDRSAETDKWGDDDVPLQTLNSYLRWRFGCSVESLEGVTIHNVDGNQLSHSLYVTTWLEPGESRHRLRSESDARYKGKLRHVIGTKYVLLPQARCPTKIETIVQNKFEYDAWVKAGGLHQGNDPICKECDDTWPKYLTLDRSAENPKWGDINWPLQTLNSYLQWRYGHGCGVESFADVTMHKVDGDQRGHALHVGPATDLEENSPLLRSENEWNKHVIGYDYVLLAQGQ